MHGEVTMGCCGHGCCVADPLAASSSVHSPLALQAAQNLHLQCRNMSALSTEKSVPGHKE